MKNCTSVLFNKNYFDKNNEDEIIMKNDNFNINMTEVKNKNIEHISYINNNQINTNKHNIESVCNIEENNYR